MPELTQQFFEQKLREQTEELKKHAVEQTEELARIIATTVVDPMEEHFTALREIIDDHKKIDAMEKWISEAGSRIGLDFKPSL